MIVVRPYQHGDVEGIRALFRAAFDKELTQEAWEWKYRNSPWGSAAVVAVDGGEIVAHYGGLKSIFWCEGMAFEVFQPCDVMTHPKYRARIFSRRGAMVKAGEMFYDTNTMDFAFGFPSERHAVLGTKQLGYTKHGYVTVLQQNVSAPKRLWNPLIKVKAGWEDVDKKELDTLWEEAKENHGLTIEKKSPYIFWRFRDNPFKRYVPIMVRGRLRRELMAFAVTSISRPEMLIMDFFHKKGIKIEDLLPLFENFAIKMGLGSMKVWVNPREDIFRTFIEKGFNAKDDIPYIFKIVNNELTPELLFEKYCYRMGDYDAA